MRAPRVAVVSADLQPLWTDQDGCWCSRDLWIFRYDYATGCIRRVFRLPPQSHSLTGRFKDALARSRLRRHLSPGPDQDNLVQLDNGVLLVVFDQVYRFTPGQQTSYAQPLPCHANLPLEAPLRGGVAVHGRSQHAYFGEYLNGHQRAIRVARIDAQKGVVDVCWSFARSEIKHVHAIHYDRFRNRLWICTGDKDHESAIWFTDDEFQTVHRLGGGDQSWRAIAMFFDETGMEWGMDAGQDAPADALNRIYRFEFATGQRRERALIGNPAYAACGFSDGSAVMQTSFEPRRLQPTAEAVALWRRDTAGVWLPLLSLPYTACRRDGMGLYGHLLIPQGVGPAGQLLCTPVNTAIHAGRLLLLCWGG